MSKNSGDRSIDENIENSYEHLSRLINAKNDIINKAASCTQTLNENEKKMQEMEEILRNLDSKIVFNPIQEKINIACQEDETKQRKSTEHIYTALQKQFLSITCSEENEMKVKDELQQFDELITTVENKLNKIEQHKVSERDNLCRKIDDVNDQHRNLITSNNELKFFIENEKKCITNDESQSRVLADQINNKEIILKRLSEMHSNNMNALSHITDFKDSISASFDKFLVNFKESEELITQETADLVRKANDWEEKVKYIKGKLSIHRQNNEEYKDRIISLKNKKMLFNLVQIQSKINHQGQEDLTVFGESIANREKLWSDTKLDMKQREDKKENITNELIRQKK
ncbi:hypothetical protein WA026_013662 [Henosepilachna vigintioctopunctata]|uniref:Uncharacterized protein n=1 Tax=Henosepilachna vigintioctopunctata TaxID=420089 RepID=A0AAW1UXJ6_9CUCU